MINWTLAGWKKSLRFKNKLLCLQATKLKPGQKAVTLFKNGGQDTWTKWCKCTITGVLLNWKFKLSWIFYILYNHNPLCIQFCLTTWPIISNILERRAPKHYTSSKQFETWKKSSANTTIMPLFIPVEIVQYINSEMVTPFSLNPPHQTSSTKSASQLY